MFLMGKGFSNRPQKTKTEIRSLAYACKQVHCLGYSLSGRLDDVQCHSFQTQIVLAPYKHHIVFSGVEIKLAE